MSYTSTHICILNMGFSAHVSTTEFESWLMQIEQLLNAKQHFVLVMKTEAETTFTDDYRQIQAIWYKRYKTIFAKYCIGLARIAQDQADQIRLDSPALHAAWQVPYYVTLEHSKAMQWAVQRWL